MRKHQVLIVAVVCTLLGIAAALLFQHLRTPEPAQPKMEPEVPFQHGSTIAVSDGAEIYEIRCNRVSASQGVPEADITNMEIQIWFPLEVKEKMIDTGTAYLLKFAEFDTVEDNTGKLLTPPRRTEAIRKEYLDGEIQSSHMVGNVRGNGPVARFVLDIPARGATSLRSVKGRVEVSRVKKERIVFEDVSTIQGKPIDDARLRGLSVEPFVEFKEQRTTLTLRVPLQHARLLDWGIRAPLTYQGGSAVVPDKIDLQKRYLGDQSKNSLTLLIATPVETKTFSFNFEHVALP